MRSRRSLLALVATFAAACGSAGGSSPPDTCPLPGQVKGVALSPAGFPLDYTRVSGFLAEVAAFRDSGVMWNGAWREARCATP